LGDYILRPEERTTSLKASGWLVANSERILRSSSIFDFLTFFVLFGVFKLSESTFQTGWFLESLATQVLVIHVIRTRKIPFFQSRASLLLTVSTVSALVIGWLIPLTPLGRIFQF